MEVRDFAERILFSTDMENKLISPNSLSDDSAGLPIKVIPRMPQRPVNTCFREVQGGFEKLRISKLRHPLARAKLLHSFANHELLAIELMALCLLRFPDAPKAFRQATLRVIGDEQKHFLLYQQRIQDLGLSFGEVPVSSFFWNILSCTPTLEEFVTGMSLTLEQANLDYCLYFQRIFTQIDDQVSADLIKTVYHDEIQHVAHGVRWLQRWYPKQSLWQSHCQFSPGSLSPLRGKGIGLDRQGRAGAGLEQSYIDELASYVKPISRIPKALVFNSDCEIGLNAGESYQRTARNIRRIDEQASVMQFVPGVVSGDIVVTSQKPSAAYLAQIIDLGFPGCQYMDERDLGAKFSGALLAWANTAFCLNWWEKRQGNVSSEMLAQAAIGDQLMDKRLLPELRKQLRQTLWQEKHFLVPDWMDGKIFEDFSDICTYSKQVFAQTGLTIVVKAPFSAAGRSRAFLANGRMTNLTHKQWLVKLLHRHGSVLAEPYMSPGIDFSAVGQLKICGNMDDMSFSSFLTSIKGQYQGHFLGQFASQWPLAFRQRFYDDRTGISVKLVCEKIMATLTKKLHEQGFSGCFGVDFFLASWHGHTLVHPLLEINPRHTMAHVALGLGKRLVKGQFGLWLQLNRSQVKKISCEGFSDFAKKMSARFPVRKSSRGLMESGVFFTNDPQLAHTSLGMVAVGHHVASWSLKVFL